MVQDTLSEFEFKLRVRGRDLVGALGARLVEYESSSRCSVAMTAIPKRRAATKAADRVLVSICVIDGVRAQADYNGAHWDI